MPSLPRLFLLTISALATLGILLLGGDRYDWMPGIDASIDPSGIETDGGRALVRTVLLTAALTASAMMFIFARTRSRGEHILPLVLFFSALAVYIFSGT